MIAESTNDDDHVCCNTERKSRLVTHLLSRHNIVPKIISLIILIPLEIAWFSTLGIGFGLLASSAIGITGVYSLISDLPKLTSNTLITQKYH